MMLKPKVQFNRWLQPHAKTIFIKDRAILLNALMNAKENLAQMAKDNVKESLQLKFVIVFILVEF